MDSEALIKKLRDWVPAEGPPEGRTAPDAVADMREAADRIEAKAADIERLNALIADTAEHWMALQFKHPIQWEGAIDSAMAAACAEIEALQADNARLRDALERVLSHRYGDWTYIAQAALQETGQ